MEMIAELQRQVVALTEAQARPSGATTNFTDAFVKLAMAPARLDGHIQFADILVSLGIQVSCIVAGGVGTALSGDDSLLENGAKLGTYLSLGRILCDAANFGAIWDGTFGRFLDAIEEREMEEDEPEPGAHFVLNPGARLPDEWNKLAAKQKRDDVIDFASVVWQRQNDGLSVGQKEFRQLHHTLPSGFEIDDSLHGKLVDILDAVGMVVRNGRVWKMIHTPRQVAACVQVWEE